MRRVARLAFEMKRYYCTYFDRNYLPRGLALIRSLTAHSEGDWQIFIVCMDEDSRIILDKLSLPHVCPLMLADIERDDPQLTGAKSDRSHVEYLWTTTPAIILWLLERHPEMYLLTYLDADLFFYSSPEPIFHELGRDSVLIHEHRYTPELRDMEINGKYNVGLVSFRNDEAGKTAVRWWRERCIESCHLNIKTGKCGDQMYLNDWPERFQNVHVLQHHGAGVAPWNVDQYEITKPLEQVLINGLPLIFYHFHALTILGPQQFHLADRFYIRADAAEMIYGPYTQALTATMQDLERLDPSVQMTFKHLSLREKAWGILFSSRSASRLISWVRRTSTSRRLGIPYSATSGITRPCSSA